MKRHEENGIVNLTRYLKEVVSKKKPIFKLFFRKKAKNKKNMYQEDQNRNQDESYPIDNQITSPSVFLQNLNLKVNSLTGNNNSTSVSDVQRIRSDLSNQVQSISTKNEIQIRQLDSQLLMLQQEMKPKLQNVERQQGFTQKQIEEIRSRVSKLQTDELSPLQYKFDQMNSKFDRFMRVELEGKLKPIQDDIRQSRIKLDDLVASTNSTFKKIDDQTNELIQKVANLSDNINSQKVSYGNQLNEIQPKIEKLEIEVNELTGNLNNKEINIENLDDIPVGFAEQLKEAQLRMTKLQTETVPILIQDSSNNFLDALQQLTQFCDEKLNAIQSSLDSVSYSNQVVDQQRKQSEELLDQLIKVTFDVQHKLKTLDQDSQSQLTIIEQTIDSNTTNLRSMISELKTESSDVTSKAQTLIDDDVNQLRLSIQNSLRKLRELIKTNSYQNLQAQTEIFEQLSFLQNNLRGKDNMNRRVQAAELRLEWLIKAIQEVDNERIKAQEKNGSPRNIAIRMESIEERLASIDSRLNKLDNNGEPKSGNQLAAIQQKSLQLIQQEPKENDNATTEDSSKNPQDNKEEIIPKETTENQNETVTNDEVTNLPQNEQNENEKNDNSTQKEQDETVQSNENEQNKVSPQTEQNEPNDKNENEQNEKEQNEVPPQIEETNQVGKEADSTPQEKNEVDKQPENEVQTTQNNTEEGKSNQN